MPLGVFDNSCGRIKLHRLSVEQSAGELRWIMTFEPSCGIRDERKACCMTFGKTVFTKAPNLFKDTLGKLRLNPFGLHAIDEPLAVPLHSSGAVPGGHIAPKLIG